MATTPPTPPYPQDGSPTIYSQPGTPYSLRSDYYAISHDDLEELHSSSGTSSSEDNLSHYNSNKHKFHQKSDDEGEPICKYEVNAFLEPIPELQGDDQADQAVLLDPGHPLMIRFQSALKALLLKELEKNNCESIELAAERKKKERLREELGNQLYEIQKCLLELQNTLDEGIERLNQARAHREEKEGIIQYAKKEYDDMLAEVNIAKKWESELNRKLEAVLIQNYFIQNKGSHLETEIIALQRAEQKTSAENENLAKLKQAQDLVLNNLVHEEHRALSQLSLYKAQTQAQQDELQSMRAMVNEARMESDSIIFEKHQLNNQWNASLKTMYLRDEAYHKILQITSDYQEEIKSCCMELLGLKNSIKRNQDGNEDLNMRLRQTKGDIRGLEHQLHHINQKCNKMEIEINKFQKIIKETDDQLKRKMIECGIKDHESKTTLQSLEKLHNQKVALDKLIAEELEAQLFSDKAAQHKVQMLFKARENNKSMEIEISIKENKLAEMAFQVLEHQTIVSHMKECANDVKNEVEGEEKVLNQAEADSHKARAIIVRRLGTIDMNNKKINVLISKVGGKDLTPLEMEYDSLMRSIQKENAITKTLELRWLTQHGSLLDFTEKKEKQAALVKRVQKELLVYEQKKLRFDKTIDDHAKDCHLVEKRIDNLRIQLEKTNSNIFREKETKEVKNKETVLLKLDVVNSLKEAEKRAMDLQSRLEAAIQEKEELASKIIDMQTQLFFWEKKIEMVKEAKNHIKKEKQEEMQQMKVEIHHMMVRHTELMKIQEKLLKDMENSVVRRENIVNQAQLRSAGKNKNADNSFKIIANKKFQDLKNKIKCKEEELAALEESHDVVAAQQSELEITIHTRTVENKKWQTLSVCLDHKLVSALLQKHKNLNTLVMKQQRQKNYTALSQNKYRPLTRSEEQLDDEAMKHRDLRRNILDGLDHLQTLFPDFAMVFQKAEVMLEMD